MPNYRHLVKLPYLSGLPGDYAENVFHSISDDVAGANEFSDSLVVFYQAIDSLLSILLSNAANACSITTYALADPEPRSPVDTVTFTLTPGVTTEATEVALCMSFQGIRISGQPQARRRGRVYLGPMAAVTSTSDGRPSSGSLTTIQTAADALLTSSKASTTYAWAVYSPTDNQTVPVDNGWLDNEHDTVRSRGRLATTRYLFS